MVKQGTQFIKQVPRIMKQGTQFITLVPQMVKQGTQFIKQVPRIMKRPIIMRTQIKINEDQIKEVTK